MTSPLRTASVFSYKNDATVGNTIAKIKIITTTVEMILLFFSGLIFLPFAISHTPLFFVYKKLYLFYIILKCLSSLNLPLSMACRPQLYPYNMLSRGLLHTVHNGISELSGIDALCYYVIYIFVIEGSEHSIEIMSYTLLILP